MSRIADSITEVLSNATAPIPRRFSVRRLNAVRVAEDFIWIHAGHPPPMAEICKQAGVSQRTLQYAFQDVYHMTPKAYLNAIRLNGVRRQLRALTQQSTRVADSANEWGFWHMGQFAKDYLRLFGETPSATLAKGSESCGPLCSFRFHCTLCRSTR